MLETPLGTFKIYCNRCLFKIMAEQMSSEGKNFQVDARYLFEINLLPKYMEIECCIENEEDISLNLCVETGEDLYSVSFYHHSIKLNIGVRDLWQNLLDFKIRENGFIIKSNAHDCFRLMIMVSWVRTNNENDISTWFASDPSLI